MAKTNITHTCSFGLLWIGGWLFTLGYVQLGFWQGVLALAVWPYYLGAFLTG
jgi:hypothetical protein